MSHRSSDDTSRLFGCVPPTYVRGITFSIPYEWPFCSSLPRRGESILLSSWVRGAVAEPYFFALLPWLLQVRGRERHFEEQPCAVFPDQQAQ